MSTKVRELIKKIRACKTAEEERSVINKESAEMRNMSKEATNQEKARNILKCIYVHMMGK
jgi:AP-1 complex subunit gamma-1